MKKVLLFVCMALISIGAFAQSPAIFSTLQDDGTIVINQSKQIEDAVAGSVLRNVYKKNKGYRVRIFFDNSQTARKRSQAMATGFKTNYPDIPVYLVFEDLYFKVTVGDFRTKSEAMHFKEAISKSYPSAFVTSEQVNFLKSVQETESVPLPADSTEVQEEVMMNDE